MRGGTVLLPSGSPLSFLDQATKFWGVLAWLISSGRKYREDYFPHVSIPKTYGNGPYPCTGPGALVHYDVRLGDSGWLRSSTHGAKKFLQKNGEYYEGQPCRSAGRRGLVARESVAKRAS